MLKKLIPQKHHYVLSNIKNALIGGYAQTYYSQFGEDIIISKLLKKSKGVYVDVGAHHPKRYSNTYLLYKRGWRGVNIDANPHTIKLFTTARPRDTNVCVGVGASEGELSYYAFSDPAVNTFKEEEAQKWMGKNWLTYEGVREVPVRTLKNILLEVPLMGNVDLLSIDVEGMDLDVLQSNDWSLCTPEVIVVESAHFNPNEPEKDSVFMYLRNHSYSLKAFVGTSLIFSK